MGEPMTCFMESMWKDLPTGILETVFAFLPMASVYRFRVLSKHWNTYIGSAAFSSKHGKSSSAEEYAVMTLRWGSVDGGWNILNVAKGRFVTLSDDFLTKYVQQQGIAAPRGNSRKSFRRTYLAASDGGLFCVRYFFDKQTSGLFVCNPLLKTARQLPPLAGWGDFVQTAVMSTNRASMEYEILVVNTAMYYTVGTPCKPESILIYESKTGRWRPAPYRPITDPAIHQVWWWSLTVFENNLFCIVNKDSRDGIASYDKETGVVSDLPGIDFPSARSSRLVGTPKGRLFCVTPIDDGGDDFPLVQIFEITIASQESVLVTEMPRELLTWLLGHDLHDKYPNTKGGIYEMESNIKVAIGSADSILICTVVGRCVAFSLSNNSWYQFPDDHTLLQAYCQADMTREELYGSNYCLSLCAP